MVPIAQKKGRGWEYFIIIVPALYVKQKVLLEGGLRLVKVYTVALY